MPHRRRRTLVALVVQVACGFDSSGLGGGGGGLGETTGQPMTASGSSPPSDTTAATGVDTMTTTTAQTTQADTAEASSSSATTTDDPVATGESAEGTSDCPANWWDAAWTRRRPLVVAGNALEAALPDAVVLVRLAPNSIDYAATAPGGADLRFVVDGGELAHEIEAWVPGGDSLVWVRLDAALPAGVEVDMYYGNPDAPPTSDGPATWATDYVSVHHLHGLTDATGSGHDASSQLPPTNTTGLVAGAQYFDGNDDFLTLAGEGDYDFATELTAEAWIRVEAFDVDWQAIVNKGDDAWRLQRALNTSAINFGSDPPNHNLNGTAPVDDGQWHHVAIVYGAGIKRIYVDGTQDVEAPLAGPLTDTDADVTLGSNVDAGGRNFFGAIDEVRISSVARSRDYFEWQRASVGLPGVVAVGAEQSCVER